MLPRLSDINFDLRNPCDDCPFRTDAPFHEGVAGGMMEIVKSIKLGTFAHTCHKTDERADCPAERRAPRGAPVQHCAGALIMMEKSRDAQSAMIIAEAAGIYDPRRLNMNAPVFGSLSEMLLYYGRMCAQKFPQALGASRLLAMCSSKGIPT